MVDVTGSTDEQTVSGVVIDPLSTNPQEVRQTSTLQTTDTGGVGREGFELSTTVTGSDVAEQVNVTIVIDTSGSTAGDSGTDFNGDGVNETILEAELFAAAELFSAYADAGYDPDQTTISVVTYSTNATVVGEFRLDQPEDYFAALDEIADDGPGGFTNYEAGLEAAGEGLAESGASPDDTNLVVFLSDGFPFPGGQDIEGAAEQLEEDWNASITGIGVGENSDVASLDLLDNTGGATQVLSGEQLVEAVVEPLTDIDFLRFEIELQGFDENGDPLSQTIILNEGDPEVIKTPTGWSFDCLPIDEQFQVGTDLEVTVNSVFAEDPGNPGSGEQVVTTQHALTIVVCFVAGTMILTPGGEVPIETLEAGDRVITRDHGVQRIRWIGATTFPAGYVAANPPLRPVVIRKDALGPGAPARDLRVSRQHRILVRDWRAAVMFGDPAGVLTPAFTLCNDSTILEERPAAPVTYLHMAFDRHEVVYANGLEAESFHPADRTVAGLSAPQREELLAIFPHLRDGFAYEAARKELKGREAALLAVRGEAAETQGQV